MIREASAFLLPLVLVSLAMSGTDAAVRRDTQFPVQVRHTVKADSAKVGDPVEFRTDEAVLIGNNVVIPEDATILGTIIKVERRSRDSRQSLIRIRIHTLRWKTGEAALNAMVSSIRRPYASATDWHFHDMPTFVEGIRVTSYQRRDAYTDFSSDQKNVTLRAGVALMLRQIDPEAYPDRDFKVYTPDSQRTAQNWR